MKSRHATAALVLLGGVLWLYRDVLSSLVRQWASDDNYSHGFLIIPIALYCAWERRDALARLEARPHVVGLLLVLASLVVFAIGTLAVGRVALGRLVLGSSRVRKLTVDDLEVKRLRVGELKISERM